MGTSLCYCDPRISSSHIRESLTCAHTLASPQSKPPILKTLHSLAYSRPAKASEVKANLLAFSGLPTDDVKAQK
jgi:hypothetical protein